MNDESREYFKSQLLEEELKTEDQEFLEPETIKKWDAKYVSKLDEELAALSN